jgi:hypothetical protein
MTTRYRTMTMKPGAVGYGVWEEFDTDDLEKRFGAARAAQTIQQHRVSPEASLQVFRNGDWRDHSERAIPQWQKASELELETLRRHADTLRGMPRLRYTQQAEALERALERVKQAEDRVREQKGRVDEAEVALKEADALAKKAEGEAARKRRELDRRLKAHDLAGDPEREKVAV